MCQFTPIFSVFRYHYELKNVKDRLDMRRMNVSSELTLDRKLFVEFIAHIYDSGVKTLFTYKFTTNQHVKYSITLATTPQYIV